MSFIITGDDCAGVNDLCSYKYMFGSYTARLSANFLPEKQSWVAIIFSIRFIRVLLNGLLLFPV